MRSVCPYSCFIHKVEDAEASEFEGGRCSSEKGDRKRKQPGPNEKRPTEVSAAYGSRIRWDDVRAQLRVPSVEPDSKNQVQMSKNGKLAPIIQQKRRSLNTGIQ
jgi:hypothetical protein